MNWFIVDMNIDQATLYIINETCLYKKTPHQQQESHAIIIKFQSCVSISSWINVCFSLIYNEVSSGLFHGLLKNLHQFQMKCVYH